MSKIEIIEVNESNINQYAICGYKDKKKEGYKLKIDWLKNNFLNGIKHKILHSDEDGDVGGIEYIPGEYAYRPVNADGFIFINCIYIISRKYKGKGYGKLLLEDCINYAKEKNKLGVATVTRKGTWMPGNELFIKNGFKIVDQSPPDFELLTIKFNDDTKDPKFIIDYNSMSQKYGSGLIIFKSAQCPFLAKSVKEINETAKKEYNIIPTIINLDNYKDAQKSPCAFGTFCIAYNGKVVTANPISSSRFKNIMNKEL